MKVLEVRVESRLPEPVTKWWKFSSKIPILEFLPILAVRHLHESKIGDIVLLFAR